MSFEKLINRKKGELMKLNYRMWKIDSLDEAGYFVIFQGFLENNILKNISGNALRLYIYLGLNANNLEGVVWHSNKRIGEYFNKSERTIRTWMKELEDFKLIRRMRLIYDGKVFTYLQTYESKKFNKILERIEGILFIDSRNQLQIVDSENKKIPIPVRAKISVKIPELNYWIDGKINLSRNLDWDIFDYIFVSDDKDISFKIENYDEIRVRATIYE